MKSKSYTIIRDRKGITRVHTFEFTFRFKLGAFIEYIPTKVVSTFELCISLGLISFSYLLITTKHSKK